MVARGEVLLQPKASPRNTPEVPPAEVSPTLPSFGEMGAAAGLIGEAELGGPFKSVKSELFGRVGELITAAFRDPAIAAAAREMVTAAVREVREEVVAADRDPKGSVGSSQKPADATDPNPA